MVVSGRSDHTEQRREPQAVAGARTFRIADGLLSLAPGTLLRISGVGPSPGEWLRAAMYQGWGRVPLSGHAAG